MLEDFETKTDYLIETKGLLKDRINSLGGSITSGTTFRDYLVWLDSLYEALEEKTITGLPDSLEGKCEQTGTPTPTSPQPINTTTGRQVVSVRGKNLLDLSTILVKKFIVKTTGNVGNSADWSATDFIVVAPNTTYRLSGITNGWSGSAGSAYYDKDMNYISGESSQTYTFNTPSNCQYIRISLNSETPTNVMLEKGNQATTYEEYKGNDYEINLGKNLYNANDTTYYGSCTYVSGINTDQYTIKATGTDVIINSQVASGSSYSSGAGTLIPCKYGETIYYDTGNSNFTKNFITQYNSSKVSLGFANTGRSSGSYTPTNSACEYISIRIGYGSATSGTEYTLAPIIEKGSTGSSYSPYKTPIYLGKIGTYQDYIFRNTPENPLYDSNLEEGQWYIHKEIARIDMSTISSFNRAGSWANTTAFYGNNVIRHGYSMYDKLAPLYCNRMVSNEPALIVSNASNTGQIGLGADTNIYFSISGITTSADYVTYFKNNPTYLYCRLETPTNTLIEDEDLINQLNEIEMYTVISEDFYN